MMNERIQELVKQSGAEWDDKYHWYVGNETMKKFAELIVRECIDICRSDDWEDQRGWGKMYAHKIKKHFEVER